MVGYPRDDLCCSREWVYGSHTVIAVYTKFRATYQGCNRTSDSSLSTTRRAYRSHQLAAPDLDLNHYIQDMNLSAHTTHRIQPLDVGAYYNPSQTFSALLSTAINRKADFLKTPMRVQLQVLAINNIEHAFEAVGIFPVNYSKALPPAPLVQQQGQSEVL